MKKYFYIFLCALTPILCFGQTETNVNGWRNAKWGMTEDEVLAAFPNEAKRSAKPDAYSQGMVSTIEIPNLQISGNDFVAHFLFDAETKRLKAVNLKPDSSVKALEIIFPTLERNLTEKYGKPDFSSDKSPSIPDAKEMQRSWKKGQTRIELHYYHDPGINFELLFIVYQSIPDSDEKNL